MAKRWLLVLFALIVQTSTLSAAPATQAANDELIGLRLADGVPLRVLIEYVSQELGVNILYDPALVDERVTIKAPERLPRAALPELLRSALMARGLAMQDDPQKGWKRIVPLAQAARPGAAATQPAGAEAGAVLTQVFQLQFANPQQLAEAVKPFLSGPGASSATLEGQGLLVVTDYASHLARIEELIRRIDQPSQQAMVKFFPVKSADAARLAQQLSQLLKAQVRAAGGGERALAAIDTSFDARTNQLVVIAPKDRMEGVAEMLAALDVAVPEQQSPIRFYKLANATATDVLATIRSLEEDESEAADRIGDRPSSPRPSRVGAGRNSGGYGGSGTSQTGLGASRTSQREASRSAMQSTTGATGLGGARLNSNAAPLSSDRTGSIGQSGRRDAAEPRDAEPAEPSRLGAGGESSLASAIKTKQARVTADPNTNSIIVAGPPDAQRIYEQLIRTLDKRRPQVLIEATIVTLDTSGEFQLGVEFGLSAGSEDKQVVTFSSFGLSTPNPSTGRLTLIPGLGFNGALLSSDIADVVLRAVERSSRAKVTAAPRVLVNDNQVGTLSSISGFPFASINASDTVATTSFGDYVRVGTEITVTPHISESDYLQLEYAITLSSFTGDPIQQGNTLLPPPLKEDSVESRVTIPDGSTIVVGGLNRHNFNENKDSIPLLGHIPVLEYLFSNRKSSESTTTLFVFLRPIILRDDRFEDLRFLSSQDVRRADMPGDFPVSEPLEMN